MEDEAFDVRPSLGGLRESHVHEGGPVEVVVLARLLNHEHLVVGLLPL